MPHIKGKPSIIGTVLRTDAPSRPAARTPSLYAARGFPRAIGSQSPPGPRPSHPTPTACYRKRRGPNDGYARPPRTVRTDNCPGRVWIRGRLHSEAAIIARARLNSGLTP
jgi:hypothetical protein